MFKKFKKNDLIITNQIRSKLLTKHFYNLTSVNSVRLTLNLNKLKSFNDDVILEGLFLLEFFSSLKGNINYYKKMYQEVNLQLSSILRKSYIFYLFLILKIFYFPIVVRRNVALTTTFDKLFNYSFTLSDINMLVMLPDIYFKWNTPINCFFHLNSNKLEKSKLFLSYWNFPQIK